MKFSRYWEKNQILAKKSKCSFGKDNMNFLGHKISRKGLEPDPVKICAMTEWPIP